MFLLCSVADNILSFVSFVYGVTMFMLMEDYLY